MFLWDQIHLSWKKLKILQGRDTTTDSGFELTAPSGTTVAVAFDPKKRTLCVDLDGDIFVMEDKEGVDLGSPGDTSGFTTIDLAITTDNRGCYHQW